MRRTTCDLCGGVGYTVGSQRVGSGDWMRWVPVRHTCGKCGGSGYQITREPAEAEVEQLPIGWYRDYE